MSIISKLPIGQLRHIGNLQLRIGDFVKEVCSQRVLERMTIEELEKIHSAVRSELQDREEKHHD